MLIDGLKSCRNFTIHSPLVYRCQWNLLQTTKILAQPKEDPLRPPGLPHILKSVHDETLAPDLPPESPQTRVGPRPALQQRPQLGWSSGPRRKPITMPVLTNPPVEESSTLKKTTVRSCCMPCSWSRMGRSLSVGPCSLQTSTWTVSCLGRTRLPALWSAGDRGAPRSTLFRLAE